MAEVVAQLEKQLESERKELAYARLKIQVLEEQLRQHVLPNMVRAAKS